MSKYSVIFSRNITNTIECRLNDRHINYSEAKPKAYQSYSDPLFTLYLAKARNYTKLNAKQPVLNCTTIL